MISFPRAVLLLSLYSVSSDSHERRHLRSPQTGLQCGTHEMSEDERRGQQNALTLVKLKQSKHGKKGYQANTPKIIPVCFHLVGGILNNRVTRRALIEDLERLNRAFSQSSCCDTSLSWCNGECSAPETNIQFVMARSFFKRVIGTASSPTSPLACVKRTIVPWTLDPEADTNTEFRVKRFLRQGDGRVLNIYYADPGPGRAGYSYYPSILRGLPEIDGVVLDPAYRVGSSLPGYEEGDVLGKSCLILCRMLV